MKRPVRATGIGLLLALVGCARQPGPRKLQWDGRTLVRETTWSAPAVGVAGIVYVPRGQTLGMADVQLGLVYSDRMTPQALHAWVMTTYAASPDAQGRHVTEGTKVIWQEPTLRYLHTSSEGLRACKVGEHAGRPYIAIHACVSNWDGRALCIESDERVPLSDFCRATDQTCWSSECAARIKDVAPKLESLRDTAFMRLGR